MLGRVLVALYIAAALLISGFARAVEIPGPIYAPKFAELSISKAAFDEKSYMTHLQGKFASGCAQSPQPALRPSTQDASTYVLYVAVRANGLSCLQTVSGKYDLVFDLRSVFYGWTDERIANVRRIVTEDGSIDFPFAGSLALPPRSFGNKQVRGLLVPITKQAWGVLTEGHKVVAIRAAYIDLKNYRNKHVVVTGHTFPNVLPIVDLTGKSQVNTLSPSAVFAVTGISTASN